MSYPLTLFERELDDFVTSPSRPLSPPNWGTSSQNFRFKVPQNGGFRGQKSLTTQRPPTELTLIKLNRSVLQDCNQQKPLPKDCWKGAYYLNKISLFLTMKKF
ncbi:hypothetical protein C7B65_05815 [Phormidesmis priestleyi ULC007]|uniref:Uncharacterized protein n=1 Tax=Phormidesmis priestleyi ULC007 TaxID=1920490 RepID=A0A2T1DKC2_9CYAN|nr:hypothetical protein C7B65_05815 [Phormidesmis priestleyi ULC007]